EGSGRNAVRGRIKGVGNPKYRVLTEVPKGPGARVLATERVPHTGEVKSTFKPTDGAARGLTFCTNSWSLSTPPPNASSKVSRGKHPLHRHRLTVRRLAPEVPRRARQSEPGADPGSTAVRATAVATPARAAGWIPARADRPGAPRC